MSRIGKKPIAIPKGVTVNLNGQAVKVKGPQGELDFVCHENMTLEVSESEVVVSRPDDSKNNRALHGMTRALIQNMVTGVSQGFARKLILEGVGYKMDIKGNFIILNLGYSHPIYLKIPDGITMEATQPVNNKSEVVIKGIDKHKVGLLASKIRSFRKPEPYKGKGFRYEDEHIIRKAGKAAKK